MVQSTNVPGYGNERVSSMEPLRLSEGVAGDGAYYIHEHFHSVFRVLSIKHRHNVDDAGNNEEANEAKQDNAASRIYNE